jgi:SAM-dependent methyltransferase
MYGSKHQLDLEQKSNHMLYITMEAPIKMKLTNLVPDLLKPILRPIHWTYKKWTHYPKSRDELHQYWRQPGSGNLPHEYLEGEVRSVFLKEMINKHASQDATILEIGCNVGRNLNHLFHSGFKQLSGIEISGNAVQLLRQSFPEMAACTKIYNAPVEEAIRDFKDGEFDLVFTMAVLEHIHTNSEWIFPEIGRITKSTLITIEDEGDFSWRHFPRNYKKVFESLGMEQIDTINCSAIDGLGPTFFARIFRKTG